MRDQLPLSDSISPIQTLVFVVVVAVVVVVVVVDIAAVVVAPFIRFNITLYSNTCQSNRCLHFVQTFHSIKRRHTQIMIRFLLLVFLALDGGAFGDTQVFDILNNLCLPCELSFEHCCHLDQHFAPGPDRFLAKNTFSGQV